MSPQAADNPFEPSAEHVQRIRARADHLWEADGRPEGQEAEYLERARELDAMQNDPPGMLPNPLVTPPRQTVDGVLVEEASLQENLGEFESRNSQQGDVMQTPESREIAREFRDGER